jgi:ADP-ribose pyrophosphatase YjhB (NUDIX family)
LKEQRREPRPAGREGDIGGDVTAQLSEPWKEGIARLVRRWPFAGLMALGVRLVVPRQRMGVALVTFNAGGDVLLLRHVFHTGSAWGLPGGWLARHEAPDDGLRRELREELNLDAVLGPPLLISREGPPHHLVAVYLGWLRPGPIRFNAEILESRWFDVDNLPASLWPLSYRAIAAGQEAARLYPRPDAVERSPAAASYLSEAQPA